MKKSRVILMVSGLALATNLLLSPGLGEASNAKVTRPKLVSGATPLPLAEPEDEGDHDHPSITGHCGTGAAHQNLETDNSIAADPANNANLVAAWIQDWADAIVVGHSTDSGKTWNKSIPQTSGCTLRAPEPDEAALGEPDTWKEPVPEFVKALSGNTSAFDPWLSFGPPSAGAPSVGAPKGTVYLTSVVQGAKNSKYVVIANRSFDGGITWVDPVVLDSIPPAAAGPLGFDTSYVIADPAPARAGHAYAVWVKTDFAMATRYQQVSRTEDGGDNWSTPTPISSGQAQFFGELLILPDGALVNVAAEVLPLTGGVAGQFGGPTTLVARRSTDGGLIWTDPVVIAVADLHNVTGVRSALAPDGTIYASWMREHDSGSPAGPTFSLMYSKSADGGRTWSPTGPPDGDCGSGSLGQDLIDVVLPAGCVGRSTKGPPVTRNSIAVAGDGSVGVLFYDHRNDDEGSPTETDVWFRRSSDGGSHWTETETPVAGPYDEPPNNTTLNEVGDYQGITAAAGGFATTFSVGGPLTGANFRLEAPPTDIFFSWLPAGKVSE